MIPKDCKRLAEVDFPIAEVSKQAAREKSIRHGHPSTLHLWWARRPLASSRAVLLALLWPDPCDDLCPELFKAEARRRLPEVPGCSPGATDADLREALLRFIAAFANWDNASKPAYLDVSRALVKAAHGSDSSYGPAPVVADPFSGGGSIPLEALRLGCEAFATDLNPVACLILKVVLEDIPRAGPSLAEGLRRAASELPVKAARELSPTYPKDPDGAVPITYLWARTVRCEAPNCGAEIPLVRSFWLCKKASRRRALRFSVQRPIGKPPVVVFEIVEPRTEGEVPGGTVTRAKATCPCCRATLIPDRVRAQLAAQRGGADAVFDASGRRVGGARILAVAVLKPGQPGRHYRLASDLDYEAVKTAQTRLAMILDDWVRGGRIGPSPVPDEPVSRVPFPFGVINVWVYGMNRWGDLFSARQKLALLVLLRLVAEAGSDELREVSLLVVSKLADLCNALCAWEPNAECPRHMFGQQAIAMAWDFAEGVPTSSSSGSFAVSADNTADGVDASGRGIPAGMASVQRADAASHPLPDHSVDIWFTDPPYYDAVPYSYLSDFFYVWLKRGLPLSSTASRDGLTEKRDEIVAYEPADPTVTAYANYERRMAAAFKEGARVLSPAGVGAVVFAHKTTEGWEALLSGMISGGWTITGSWPIATEMGSRLRARDSAALATSVHLVCRPRSDAASVGDWAQVLRELPTRVAEWMERLQHEGVRGADLVFACIGPALEIFSRHSRVETAEGRDVQLDEYLAKVWEVVGRSALAQVLGTAEARARNGAAGAVEEDARLTALFLWTLQATDGEAEESAGEAEEDESADDEEDEGASRGKAKGFTLVYDVVRRFAQPLGIELPKWEGRVIETKKGVVRLLPVAERAKQLFGEDGSSAVAARLEQTTTLGANPLQGMLFPELEAAPRVKAGRGRGKRTVVDVTDESLAASREATTLDRIHAAMLLQAAGRTNALRALLKAEQDRGPDFLRLSNALSALYPKGSEERRLVDAMLLAVSR